MKSHHRRDSYGDLKKKLFEQGRAELGKHLLVKEMEALIRKKTGAPARNKNNKNNAMVNELLNVLDNPDVLVTPEADRKALAAAVDPMFPSSPIGRQPANLDDTFAAVDDAVEMGEADAGTQDSPEEEEGSVSRLGRRRQRRAAWSPGS